MSNKTVKKLIIQLNTSILFYFVLLDYPAHVLVFVRFFMHLPQ